MDTKRSSLRHVVSFLFMSFSKLLSRLIRVPVDMGPLDTVLTDF